MTWRNHTYAQFVIRNCWQAQKIFLLETVVLFFLWGTNESCRVGFFFWCASKVSSPETQTKTKHLSLARPGDCGHLVFRSHCHLCCLSVRWSTGSPDAAELACLMACGSTRAAAGAHRANCLPPCQRSVMTIAFAKTPLFSNGAA